jgi:hypothetical protein
MTQYRIMRRDPARTGRALDAGRVDARVVAGSRQLSQREFDTRELTEGWIREMIALRAQQGMASAVVTEWDGDRWIEVP